jgi:hypothetical protein
VGARGADEEGNEVKCPVCLREFKRPGVLCYPCQASREKAYAADGSLYTDIRWAAERARRFMRRDRAKKDAGM